MGNAWNAWNSPGQAKIKPHVSKIFVMLIRFMRLMANARHVQLSRMHQKISSTVKLTSAPKLKFFDLMEPVRAALHIRKPKKIINVDLIAAMTHKLSEKMEHADNAQHFKGPKMMEENVKKTPALKMRF